MAKRITVNLEAEQTLQLVATDYAPITVNRLVGGSPPIYEAQADTGITIRVGPFSENRSFELVSPQDIPLTAYTKTQEKLAYNHEGTGILTGGVLSINGSDNTKFDISAGEGVIVDNTTNPGTPTVQHVVWDAFTAVTPTLLGTENISYIAIDAKGEIVQLSEASSPQQRRELIQLGSLGHPSTTVISVTPVPYPAYDLPAMIGDFATSVGIINTSGNVISHNGGNLQISKTAGTTFNVGINYWTDAVIPNITTDPELLGPFMIPGLRDGVGGFKTLTPTNVIDVANYDDDSGTPAAIPASDPWTIWRIHVFPFSNVVVCVYGQNLYKTRAAAEASIFGEEFEQSPELRLDTLRGFLLVKRDATALNDAEKAKFIQTSKLGGVPAGGVSTATTTLQRAYDNSDEPEIMTDTTQGAFTIKEGTGTATNKIINGLNNSDVEVFNVTGEGKIKGAFQGGATGSRPGTPVNYEFYFDTTLGIPIWYDGTNWVDATGATV